jgi:hypothetical protein
MFILSLAALPLLLPHAPERLLRPAQPSFAPWTARRRLAVLGAAVAVTAVFPLVAIAAAQPSGLPVATVQDTQMPVPGAVDLGVQALVHDGRVTLSWTPQRPVGGPVFYRVLRSAQNAGSCSTRGGLLCSVTGTDLGATGQPAFVDRPKKGVWTYRVLIAANWLNDPSFGDVYAVGKPVVVRVR